MKKHIVIIDNYDSFTYNLYQLFTSTGKAEVAVYRNDKISVEDISSLSPEGLIVSPGPKSPEDAGISKAVITHFAGKLPILGVCLGMQCINEVFGGETVIAPSPWHGKRDSITHKEKGILKNIPSPFTVARYHSLAVEVNSPDLEVTAVSSDNVPMALAHRKINNLQGLQFHPESFMTEFGEEMATNFLEMM